MMTGIGTYTLDKKKNEGEKATLNERLNRKVEMQD